MNSDQINKPRRIQMIKMTLASSSICLLMTASCAPMTLMLLNVTPSMAAGTTVPLTLQNKVVDYMYNNNGAISAGLIGQISNYLTTQLQLKAFFNIVKTLLNLKVAANGGKPGIFNIQFNALGKPPTQLQVIVTVGKNKNTTTFQISG